MTDSIVFDNADKPFSSRSKPKRGADAEKSLRCVNRTQDEDVSLGYAGQRFCVDDGRRRGHVLGFLGEFVPELALADFLQRDIDELHPRICLRDGPMSLGELTDTETHDVDKQLGAGNEQLRGLQKRIFDP